MNALGRRLGVIALAGVVMLGGLGQNTAHADGDGEASTEEGVLRTATAPALDQHISAGMSAAEQNSADAATRLTLVADEVRRISVPATYSGLTVDHDITTVNVYITGEIPGELARYAAMRPLGVTVVVHDKASFSREQSMAAVSLLIQNQAWVERLGLTQVSVAPDGSGIVIGVVGAKPDPATTADLETFLNLPGGVRYRENAEAPRAQPAKINR